MPTSQAISDIYNHYVLTSHVTFDVEPTTPEQRREWFSHYGTTGRHRLLVAVDGEILGYATSSPFKDRRAYETSVETSVYLAPTATQRGIGALLYDALFAALAGEDVHRAYAEIALPNPGSVALHERFGFRKVAHFTEVGRKMGSYWDVAWYERAVHPARRGVNQ